MIDYLHLAWDMYQEGDPNETSRDDLEKAIRKSYPYTLANGVWNAKLWGGAIHTKEEWVAYIKYVSGANDSYTLHIQVDGQETLNWNVKTYNPAFGAWTVYMHWHGDKLVYIYAEKHSLYCVVATTSTIERRVELGFGGLVEVNVENDILLLTNTALDESRNYLVRYKLPDWEKLPMLSKAEGQKQGWLK